jgi:hypothetical protein
MLDNLPSWLKSATGFTMAAGGPTRHDTYSVSVDVYYPGSTVPILSGVWDKMSGGAVDSDELKYHPGGMQPPVALGGKKMVSNVVVSRLYRLGRDHDAVGALIAGVGKSRVTVSKQPLDLTGTVYGNPIVYQGVLKRCTTPDPDSEGTAAALIELEVTVEGYPTS